MEKIDLTRNLINDLHNGVFANLTKLKELYLSGNRLKRFSPELIESCPNLQVLRLDSNDLLNLNDTKIMEYAPKLKKIALSNNQIRCKRVNDMIGTFKADLIDKKYVEQTIESTDRIPPTTSVESILCLDDISWAAAHYTYMYTKITKT